MTDYVFIYEACIISYIIEFLMSKSMMDYDCLCYHVIIYVVLCLILIYACYVVYVLIFYFESNADHFMVLYAGI